MPARKVDLNDRDSVLESMERWKARSVKEDRIVKRHIKYLQHARAMVVRRRKQAANVVKRQFGARVVTEALKYVGQTESPANSNRGKLITAWQERFGLKGGGYPWCGAFVGAIVEQAGGDVTNRIVYTPYIPQDAKAKTNGFSAWVDVSKPHDARVGDLVLFNWPGGASVEHVGILRKPYKAGSLVVETVEGNTSPTNAGSQANGGGVFLRTRPLSLVVGFARPKEKA